MYYIKAQEVSRGERELARPPRNLRRATVHTLIISPLGQESEKITGVHPKPTGQSFLNGPLG